MKMNMGPMTPVSTPQPSKLLVMFCLSTPISLANWVCNVFLNNSFQVRTRIPAYFSGSAPHSTHPSHQSKTCHFICNYVCLKFLNDSRVLKIIHSYENESYNVQVTHHQGDIYCHVFTS